MGIRHDEEREQGRRQNQEKEKEEEPRWEDTTVVSVMALMAFLESLTAEQHPQNSTPAAAVAPGGPPQSPAATAAKAYQATAGEKTQPQPAPSSSGSKPILTPEELATIIRLLHDLKFLADKRIESLTILRSESFLQSLVDAAARARQGL